MDFISLNILILATFLVGYIGIIFEHKINVNKAGVALLLGALLWLFIFIFTKMPLPMHMGKLMHQLSEISQILFFLLGAMTLVELIDSHKGFNFFSRLIHSKSKRKLLWIVSFLCFGLSAVLDNLTTTILMVSILRKLIPDRKDRFVMNCMVVIGANAGGAWTPIGDVTTTMLWINGQISSLAVMRDVFLPSLVSMLVPLGIYTFLTKGKFKIESKAPGKQIEYGGMTVLILGMLGLISVPAIKAITGLPPFMGMLIALAVLWLVTDALHHKDEGRQHLRVPTILTKVDVSVILFFLGILLSIAALESIGLLDELAHLLNKMTKNPSMIATSIGLLSSVVDNVPLVAASMGMYDMKAFPMDSNFWLLVAYAAGTGGSILIIGSSSGVAMMGMEKVDFMEYAKKATIPALIGYLAGVGVFILLKGI
jgi:Na+/H+ antiporter NhaD/arsenite permease-like protein